MSPSWTRSFNPQVAGSRPAPVIDLQTPCVGRFTSYLSPKLSRDSRFLHHYPQPMSDSESSSEDLVSELREVATASAAAVIIVRYLVDDVVEHAIVYANERDPLAHLSAHRRAGATPVGLLVWTDDGQGGVRLRHRPYEGHEDAAERMLETFSPPAYFTMLLSCPTCCRATVHLVEHRVRSPHACLHGLLLLFTLGLWLLVMHFSMKWKRVACMICGTSYKHRLPELDHAF